MSIDDYLIITEEQWKEKQKEIEAAEKMAAKVWEKYSQMVANINLYTEQSETAARSAENQMKMLPSLVSGLDQYMQDSIYVLQAAGKYIPLPADDWVKKAETVSIAIHKLVGEMSLLPDQINKLDLKKATLYFDNIRYGAESIEIFGNAHDILKDVDKALSGIYKTFKEGSSVAGSWKGVQDSIVQIRNGLTNIEKGAITTVAAFAEFTVVHDSIMNLVTGSDSVTEGLGKIVVAAGIAGTAMYTALGPAGLAVAAVTGLIAVLKGVSDAQEEAFNATPLGQFSQKMDELRENISAKSAEIRESLSEMTDGIKDAGVVEANMARDLAEAYEELAGKTSLTAEEQAKMRDISERLVDLVPSLNDYIDEQTGCLRIQGETLDGLIDKMALYAQQQAIQGLMTDAYTKQYEADKLKRETMAAYQETANEYLADLNWSESIKNMILEGDVERAIEWQRKHASFNDFAGLERDFGTTDGYEIAKNLNILKDVSDQYKQACQEADEISQEVAETIDYLESKYEDVTSQIYHTSEAIDDNKTQTAEYAQVISDLKEEFRNLDLDISDELAGMLVLEDTATVESVTEMFGKLKDQTALSAGELQELFAAIAPGISEQFAESLAVKSPEMQLQMSMTLADMAAGAEVSKESLQELFRMLGMELPGEVISAFQEQTPFMQIAAVNLFSGLAEGKQLSEESLLEVFSALGMQIPEEIITSLSGREADVQQKAVSLLAQIKAAPESERESLIAAYNSLGLATLDEGFLSAFDSMQGSIYESTQGALGQVAAAGNDEKGVLMEQYGNYMNEVFGEGLFISFDEMGEDLKQHTIQLLNQITCAMEEVQEGLTETLKEFGTELAGMGFIAGIDSETDHANTSGKELVFAVEAGISEMTRVLNPFRLGEAFGDGYAEGIRSKIDKVRRMAGELPKAASGEIKYVQRSASPSKVTRGLGNDFSEGYELGITDNEEDVQETVEDWITRLRNQVMAFAQLPVDVELVRPEFPSMSDTAVSRISSTCAVPVTAEFGPEKNTYVRECVRQNTLLEEQNVLLRNQNTLLKDIHEKPVIQDSDVFSSYQRSQRSYFAATGRTGISGVD